MKNLKKSKGAVRASQTEGGTFRYYNCNPHHKSTCDCVIRAISAGEGETWEKVLRDLTEYMIKYGDMLSTPELYGRYLKDKGWVKQKQPRTKDGKKVRIKDFLQTFKGQAIIHAGREHVSYLDGGYVWDLWDCSNDIIGNYWIYQEA